MQRLRRAAILLVCLALVSGILASCSSSNTSAAGEAAVPLAKVSALNAILCPEDNDCQNYTGVFTTAGPFAVMWLCYGRNWKSNSVALSISVYDSEGRQIDNLNELCPSGRDSGTIAENRPAGKYSVSITESYGPAASVVVLGTLASASQ